MQNLSLRAKLFVGFGIMLLFISVVGYAGIYSLNKLVPATKTMYVDRLEPAAQMAVIMRDWFKIRATMFANMLEQDQTVKAQNENAMSLLLEEIKKTEAAYEATYLVPEEQSVFAEYKRASAEYLEKRTKVLELTHANDTQGAYIASKEARPALETTITKVDRLLKIQQEVGKQILEENEKTATSVYTMIYSLGGGALLIGIFLAIVIARLIANPIEDLQTAAEKVAQGKLEIQINNTSEDEIGKLSKSFSIMVRNIRTAREESETNATYLRNSVNQMLSAMEQFSRGDLTVRLKVTGEDTINMLFDGFNTTVEHMRQTIMNVSTATSTASAAANQLAATAEEMSRVAHDQAHKTSMVASSVDEMLQTVRTNASATTQTANVAASNGKSARTGGDIVEKTLVKMRDIADVVTKSAGTVRRLGDSSANIGEIVSVIDEIADQTNLLALNAAIEAARAGEQGRGFAVVADEVRKLAERTSIATKQISQTIRQIQEETESAVNEMQRGSKEVSEGMALADEAGRALQNIVEGTSQVQDMVTQIAAATEEQSQTSEQIADNVNSMASSTEETTNALNEVVNTVASLSEMTENLNDLIARFHTDTHIQMAHPSLGKSTHGISSGSRRQIGM